jgi:hypothetical protein
MKMKLFLDWDLDITILLLNLITFTLDGIDEPICPNVWRKQSLGSN